MGYYSGDDSAGVAVSPAVGTLSASLHTRAAVQDFIGDTSPAYYAAAAILSHVNPTSIHVLSLGDPTAPVTAQDFATYLEELANTSEVHLPDIFLMPGIAGAVDGTALAAVNAYTDGTNVLLGGTALVRDALYAAMDAYANAVNRHCLSRGARIHGGRCLRLRHAQQAPQYAPGREPDAVHRRPH